MNVLNISGHVAVTGTIFWVLRLVRYSPQLYPVVWFVSSAAHELSHLLIGLVFLARPVSFSVIPRRSTDGAGWRLGAVGFTRLRWWNQLLVGLAPLVLLPPLAVWLLVDSLSLPLLSWLSTVMKFGAMQCFVGSWPSPPDWAYTWRTIVILLGLGCLALVGYFIFL